MLFHNECAFRALSYDQSRPEKILPFFKKSLLNPSFKTGASKFST